MTGLTDDEKTKLTIERLHLLADLLEKGEIKPIEFRDDKVLTAGKGKHKPRWDGRYVMAMMYFAVKKDINLPGMLDGIVRKS